MEFDKDILIKFYQEQIDNKTSFGKMIANSSGGYDVVVSNVEYFQSWSIQNGRDSVENMTVIITRTSIHNRGKFKGIFTHRKEDIRKFITNERTNKWNLVSKH